MTTATFTDQITAFISKASLRAVVATRRIAEFTYTQCVTRSPVDTGRFRGSWRIGIGQIDLDALPDLRPLGRDRLAASQQVSDLFVPQEPITAEEQAYAEDVLQNALAGETIIISNNVPYAHELEQGHSGQAPAGVLQLSLDETLANIDAIVAKVIAELP